MYYDFTFTACAADDEQFYTDNESNQDDFGDVLDDSTNGINGGTNNGTTVLIMEQLVELLEKWRNNNGTTGGTTGEMVEITTEPLVVWRYDYTLVLL